MKGYCKITEISKRAIENYPWIKANFILGEINTRDDRVLTRLLENTHYPHISETLKLIDKYGSESGEIGRSILSCKDYLGLPRILAEMSLFAHLNYLLGKNVTQLNRITNEKTPDFSVVVNDYKCLIEVYSPMDYYGYQTFKRLFTNCVKNLSVDKGFEISIKSDSDNLSYTYEFPEFRGVFDWLEKFKLSFSEWLYTAKIDDIFNVSSPAASLKLALRVNSIHENSEMRFISWIESTKLTDTIQYFRISDSVYFAKSQWGKKIKEKLMQQQAGKSGEKVVRILAINFALAETAELSFLNEPKYQSNFAKHIKYLVSDIELVPFDVVLACELGTKCGFSKPIILSNHSQSFVEKLLSKIGFNIPIRETKIATEDQINAFWNTISNSKIFL
jgi:hypothetical protein